MSDRRRAAHTGIFYVLENDPAAGQRWFCHADGTVVPGVATVDDAVAWGIAHARTVIVRTLANAMYWAGERPSGWGVDLAPWPPLPSERRQIEIDYEAACARMERAHVDRAEYEDERDRWLRCHAPDLLGRRPVHKCLIVGPDAGVEIEFEEMDCDGVVCGAHRRGGGARGFGSAAEAIATSAGLPVDDPWVEAVSSALARERAWIRSTNRRSTLVVRPGEGEMFHATAIENRESILRHGLDWSRMGAARGIAGSRKFELPAIFLCESRDELRFFTRQKVTSVDIWAVRVEGLWIENGPRGWVMLPEPVGPDRLRLLNPTD